MSKYDLLRTIIGKSIVLSNFYTNNPTDKELDELYELLKKDMNKLELEDIVLEKLNDVVSYWNFVYKYDFKDKMEIKSKIYKFVRDNKITLEMDNELISNQVLMHKTCINRTEYCETINDTAMNGHLGCLRYLREKGCKWDKNTCLVAATNGRIEYLKYLHENGCEWNEWTCTHAAYNGHLECLRYAHENGCKCDKNTCMNAAYNGHLECLRYAHEKGCPWDERTCACAAKNGHLECLKYLHEKGCPWDERTCAYAASYGHLECLRYAHEKGCGWDKKTCGNAVEGGNIDCITYVYEKKCPGYESYIREITKKLNIITF
jgi:hypothetical protein